jgi:hypothetical protein
VSKLVTIGDLAFSSQAGLGVQFHAPDFSRDDLVAGDGYGGVGEGDGAHDGREHHGGEILRGIENGGGRSTLIGGMPDGDNASVGRIATMGTRTRPRVRSAGLIAMGIRPPGSDQLSLSWVGSPVPSRCCGEILGPVSILVQAKVGID